MENLASTARRKLPPINYWLLFSILFILILQFINALGGGTGFFVLDETYYKSLSLSLFQSSTIPSFQYPLLYPWLTSVAFLFNSRFYDAVRVINVLLSLSPLLLCYGFLKKEIGKNYALLCGILCSLMPIMIRHTKMMMAESLMLPLLLLAIFFHLKYRDKKSVIRNTIIAALTVFALLITKYIALPLVPVFALFWATANLPRKNYKKSLWQIFLKGLIYGGVILGLLFLYTLFFSLRNNIPLNFTLFKQVLGLSSATGPDRVGYSFRPGFKWLVLYSMYAFMITAPLIGMIITFYKRVSPTKKKAVNTILLFFFFIGVMLIYTSARHSTLAPYNAGGQMLKMLGRYVSYLSPLATIAFFSVYCACEDPDKKRLTRRQIIPVLCLWVAMVGLYIFSYFTLYKGLFWPTKEDFLNVARGFDLAGLYLYNKAFVALQCALLLTFMGSLCLPLTKKIQTFIITCLLLAFFLPNAFIASISNYELPQFVYSKISTTFLNEYGKNKNIVLFCDNNQTFKNMVVQSKQFWEIGTLFTGVSVINYNKSDFILPPDKDAYLQIRPSALSPEKLGTLESQFLTGSDLSRDIAFVLFSQELFAQTVEPINHYSIDYDADGNVLIIVSGKDQNMSVNAAIMVDNHKLTTTFSKDNQQYSATVPLQEVTEQTANIYLIDFSTLQKSPGQVISLKQNTK